MNREYGTYRWVPRSEEHRRPVWQFEDVPPHVVIRLKRWFPRTPPQGRGTLIVFDTPESCRDLDAFLTRFPMRAANGVSLARLQGRSEEFDRSHERVLRIFDGDTFDYGWQEPSVQPRPYQLIIPDVVEATGRILCTDDVGLGKTFSGSLILRNPAALPALVVTLAGRLTDQWQKELNRFFPWLLTHIIETRDPYEPADRHNGVSPDVLITNYHKLAGWADVLSGKLATVIWDEMHELRHLSTRKYAASEQITIDTRYRVGLTATPVYNYAREMWAVANLLDPDALGTEAEFTREWCEEGAKGKVTDPTALGTYLRDIGLMVGRTRADVGRELPHGEAIPIEQPVETDSKVLDRLAGDAVEMAHLILDQRTSPQERFRIENQFEMKMRQATGVAKAPFVASFIELLLTSQNKVGVFLWHREVYDILMDRLEQYRPVMYSGSETPRQKNESFDAFVDGDARVLLMSLRSGAGLDGMQRVCSTAVHAEFDWSPMQHDQANGRFARDGQTEPVMAFYMVADEGSDPVMIELLNVKRNQAESIMHPGGKLIQPSAMSASDRVRMLAESYLKQRGHRVPAAAPRATARIVQPALL